ncbi:MAG: hypothetical protein AAGI30_10105 [Planctomycetota bacterium]
MATRGVRTPGSRTGIASVVAPGLACVSIALGLLYLDGRRRERAYLEAVIRGDDLSEAEYDELLEAWGNLALFVPSLVSGTPGVALLGFGATLAVFELPAFRRRTPM